MRVVGAILVLGGSAGMVWGVVAATTRKRPIDLAAALLAPIALLTALAGGVLLFVPGFFG